MYASLDRVDLTAETEAGTIAYQTDHRDGDAMVNELELSTLFKIARGISAQRDHRFDQVIFVHAQEPPAALVEVMQACGAGVEVGDQLTVEPGPVNEGLVQGLAHLALRRLGQEVLRRAGAPRNVDGLRALEQAMLESQAGHTAGEDPAEWWRAVVELAAAVGEVLLAERSGAWQLAPDDGVMYAHIPLLLVDNGTKYNVFGRCERFFERGKGQEPSGLLRKFDPEELGAGAPMFKLVPGSWTPPRPIHMERLLDGQDPRIPQIAYGRDLPDSFAYTRGVDGEAVDFAALRAAGLPTLRAVAVTIERVADILVVVHGDYYASEKLLDPEFMQGLHETMDCPLLAAAVPVRGLLGVVNGAEPSHVAALQQFIALQQQDAGEHEHISDAIFGVHEGVPLALVGLVDGSE